MTNSITSSVAVRTAMYTFVLACMVPSASASDDTVLPTVERELYVTGKLTESACRLEMVSPYQAIDMGITGTSSLLQGSMRGEPVPVQMQILGCHRDGSSEEYGSRYRDEQGNLVWSRSMPSVSFSFISEADADNPQLVRAKGISGMGLRIADQEMNDLSLGARGRALLLTPGSTQVTYHIIPERTTAPLRAGSYHAMLMYRLNYE